MRPNGDAGGALFKLRKDCYGEDKALCSLQWLVKETLKRDRKKVHFSTKRGKSKGHGSLLTSEHSFNVPRLSAELSTLRASDDAICREAATIINDYDKHQPSVIREPLRGRNRC